MLPYLSTFLIPVVSGVVCLVTYCVPNIALYFATYRKTTVTLNNVYIVLWGVGAVSDL